MLKAVENFFAAIADDFIQPRAAIDGDEERAFVQTGRLRVGGEIRIDQMIPDFQDFRFGAASVQAQIVEHFWQNRARGRCWFATNFFKRIKVQATPGSEHALARS